MPPNVLVRMALANSDDGAAATALHEIAAQKLRQSFYGCLTHVAFHLANAAGRKIANDTTMAVKNLITIIQQPVADQWWNTALLSPLRGVVRMGGGHVVPLAASEGGRCLRTHWESPSLTVTGVMPESQGASPPISTCLTF